MKDSWASSDPYEYFMGRWSRLVARSFLNWLSPLPDKKWLDVGCGTGALTEEIINNHEPAQLTAVDQYEGFLIKVQQLGNWVDCKIGNALALPLEDSSINITVSGLVLNFISEPDKALSEMKRVTAPGGTVAAYVWDYAGKMDFLNYFWDVAAELDPKASDLHESKRFPDTNTDALDELFISAGFVEPVTLPIEIETNFQSFDDYWKPFLGGQGPAPTYVASLNKPKRNNLRNALSERLPIQSDGSIPMVARAWATSSQISNTRTLNR
ncbi:MAG: class I SAM-dependent methyltransferase [Thermodesulfobacteriota bacterium]